MLSTMAAGQTRRGAAALILLSFLLGCDTTAAGPGESLAASFDAKRAWLLLERMVAIGPRPAGTAKGKEQRDLIAAELASYGLTPVREPFEAKTPIGILAMENVYADIEGEARGGAPPPIVVLCSHFDTKRMDFAFLGANDGGSSTAVLLELARVLAKERGKVTWRLLFLDGEEAIRPQWVDPDNCYGSRHHVAELQRTGLLARVKACVLLDLVGDADLALMAELNSDHELLNLVFGAARAHGYAKEVSGSRQQVSDDHLRFREAGIPSIDLIDFEYGPGNRYWHSPDDTLAHCSAASLEATGKIVLHALPALEAWALAR
jgi:glutaminyl-peptide cyclotransferase